jgi:hypothetical protein
VPGVQLSDSNPHLAIEALRPLVEQEMRRVTRHNIVARQSFSEPLTELMRKCTNQNLTAAEIIAELVVGRAWVLGAERCPDWVFQIVGLRVRVSGVRGPRSWAGAPGCGGCGC